MSAFSDFIRNATPEEKERVYTEVMKRASARQNAAPQPSTAILSSAPSTTAPSQDGVGQGGVAVAALKHATTSKWSA